MFSYKKLKQFLIDNIAIHRKVDLLYRNASYDYKSPRVNMGQLQAELNRQKTAITSINDFEFQVFSQFGEDGIIQFLINHLPVKNKTFIEFGVENYKEANTRFLLVNNYWSGMVIDGSEENVDQIKKDPISGYFDLRAVCSFITKENINELMSAAGFQPDLGLLSIDIDGNDYWVWNEMNVLNPDIIISEYNALMGMEDQLTIPYQPDFVRNRTNHFSLYGASLAALTSLAKKKGYFFIGCNSAGNNAYFIHEKHRGTCMFPEISVEAGYRFCSFSESRNAQGLRNRGKDKIYAVSNTPLYDIEKEKVVPFDAEKVVASLIRAGKFNGIH